MARKRGGGRRRFSKYLRGQIVIGQALGNLATGTGIRASVADVLTEQAFISSIKAAYEMSDWTDGDDEGPVIFGVAHSDYSLAEIEEWIENVDSWSIGKLPEREKTNRLIRRIGTMNDNGVVNDGKPITTKLGWSMQTGETLAFWFWNTGVQALTTGAEVHVDGHANIWSK